MSVHKSKLLSAHVVTYQMSFTTISEWKEVQVSTVDQRLLFFFVLFFACVVKLVLAWDHKVLSDSCRVQSKKH